MNFFSHLLKGDASDTFPPARKTSGTSPPPSPRSKEQPAVPVVVAPRRPSADDYKAHTLQQQTEPSPVDKDKKLLLKERATMEARYIALAAEYQKEKELHEASLDQLRQRVSRLNDSIALLREDRELLNRDVLEEREKNQKLVEENENLKLYSDELIKNKKTLEERLASLSAAELNARKFATNTRSIEDAQEDSSFRQRFNLPSTEFPIISYYCCHKFVYHGWLYITPAYICFEPALLSSESSRIVTPLTSIVSITRVRGIKYIPGTDNALSFHLMSGTEYAFSNFTHRDGVIANIVHQAAKFGHSIHSQDEKQVALPEGKDPKQDSESSSLSPERHTLQVKDTDDLPTYSADLRPPTRSRARSFSEIT